MTSLFRNLLKSLFSKEQEKARNKNQEDFMQWTYQGALLEQAGDLSGALAAFNNAISIQPKETVGYFNRGLLHRKRLANHLATADFTKAIELSAAKPDLVLVKAHINRAICYSFDRQYQKALEDWNTAIGLDPYNWASYFERARIKYLLEDYTGVIEDTNRGIELDPRVAVLYGVRAAAYAKLEDWEKAIDDYSQAIALKHVLIGDAYYERGRLYAKREQWNEAIEDMKTAIDHNFNKPDLAYVGIGNVLRLGKQEYAEAIQAYDQAIALNPDSSHAFTGRGRAYKKMYDYDKAMHDYSKAIEIEPENATPYNNRGYLYARLKQYEPSLADCNKAISIDPLKANHFGSRGHTFFLIESYSRALADFQKASEIKPKHKFAIAGIALCHYQLGQMDEAKRVWQSLIEVDEHYKEASAIHDEYDCHPKLVGIAEKVIALL